MSKFKDDSSLTKCRDCLCEFGLRLRRHHCRVCSGLVCHPCSSGKKVIPAGMSMNTRSKQQGTTAHRVCFECSPNFMSIQELCMYEKTHGFTNTDRAKLVTEFYYAQVQAQAQTQAKAKAKAKAKEPDSEPEPEPEPESEPEPEPKSELELVSRHTV